MALFFDVAQTLPLHCTALHYLLGEVETCLSSDVNGYFIPKVGDFGPISCDWSPKIGWFQSWGWFEVTMFGDLGLSNQLYIYIYHRNGAAIPRFLRPSPNLWGWWPASNWGYITSQSWDRSQFKRLDLAKEPTQNKVVLKILYNRSLQISQLTGFPMAKNNTSTIPGCHLPICHASCWFFGRSKAASVTDPEAFCLYSWTDRHAQWA